MKITDASIQSSSTHKLETRKEVYEKLELFSGRSSRAAEEPAYVLDIGSEGPIRTGKTCLSCDTECTEDQDTQIKLKLIEDFIFQLTGKTVKLWAPKLNIEAGSSAAAVSVREIRDARQRDQWGLVYEYKELTREAESLKFSASGMVTTTDGRTVEFNLDFLMSREYVDEHYINIRMGSAKVDPLVVVFGRTGVPKFSRIKAAFDLDADGKDENISMPAEGSGFLALDKNGDGVINDGSELFGPQSGDGFADLREYDIDGNGWIDESDDVFGKLTVMTSLDGKRISFKLGDLGIGAICLKDIGTQYGFKDLSGEYGEMKSSSVFLREDGSAGTVHHIDLVI